MATASSPAADLQGNSGAADCKAFVAGCEGTRLSADELAFFRAERPFGLILFARNCEEPEAIADLCAAFRDAVGRQRAPVFIDQEGGRVQRLRPPHWDRLAPARAIGRLAEADEAAAARAAWLHGRLIAHDLTALGIDVDCAPVLDVLAAASSEAIGDRAFSTRPDRVRALGQALSLIHI